ncbi:MAG: hypothetical protein DHS80DRAFT_25694 [Piptocephalis tieghemiana]|nr:MAG: hypothetical protein DHS80DRAFT_25694 [Piptocephalis tieghemiana]
MALAALKQAILGLSRPRIRPPVQNFPSPPGPSSGASRAHPLPERLRHLRQTSASYVSRLISEVLWTPTQTSLRTLPPPRPFLFPSSGLRPGLLPAYARPIPRGYRYPGPFHAIRAQATRGFHAAPATPAMARGWAGNPLAVLEQLNWSEWQGGKKPFSSSPFQGALFHTKEVLEHRISPLFNPPCTATSFTIPTVPEDQEPHTSSEEGSYASSVSEPISSSSSSSPSSFGDMEDQTIDVVVDMPHLSLTGMPAPPTPEELRHSLDQQQQYAAELSRMIGAASIHHGLSVQVTQEGQGIRLAFDPDLWSVDAIEAWMKAHGPREAHARLILPLDLVDMTEKPKKDRPLSFSTGHHHHHPDLSSPHHPSAHSSSQSSSWCSVNDPAQEEEVMEAMEPLLTWMHEEEEEVQQARRERVQAFLTSLALHEQTDPFNPSDHAV